MKTPSTLVLYVSLAHLLDLASAYSNSYLNHLSGTQLSSNENNVTPVRDAATKSSPTIPFGVNSNPDTYFGYKSRNSMGLGRPEGEPSRMNDASERFAQPPRNVGENSHPIPAANYGYHPGRDDYYYQQPPSGSPHYSRQPDSGMVNRDPNWQGRGYDQMMNPDNGYFMAPHGRNYHEQRYNVNPNYYSGDINPQSSYNPVVGYSQFNRPLVRYQKNRSHAPSINQAMEASGARYFYNRSNGQYHNNPHYNTLSPQGRSQYEWFVRGETSATLRNKSMNDSLYSY